VSASPRLRVMLAAQAAFMIGFSSVVPFIAVLADDRFALGPAAVGATVGARVAVQQGLFIVGGALADRLGPRALLLTGCAVRAVGFVMLALAPTPAVFVIAVLLIGMAGALFSPAVDAYVGAADAASRARPRPVGARRWSAPTPFAALALAGEAGGIVGAAVGALFMPAYAVPVVIVASAVFIAALVVLARLLPARPPAAAMRDARVADGAEAGDHRDLGRPRRVLPSAIGAATVLAVYTQLFSLLPLGMAARGVGGGWVGAVSIVLSATVVLLQWPLSRVAERLTRPRAVAAGVAAALAAAVAGAVSAAAASVPAFAAAAASAAVCTALAVMLATPSAQSLVAAAGPISRRATRLGALASAGGVLALAASALAGAVAGASGLAAAWLIVALLPAAGLVFACIGARTVPDPTTREEHHDHPPSIPEDRRRRPDRPSSAGTERLLRRRWRRPRRRVR
jgi:MFS family permease